MIQLRRILFPTDFSPLADAALDVALEIARRHGAELHMLHAVVLHADDPNDPAHHFPDADEIRRRLEKTADDRMSRQLGARNTEEVRVVRAQRRGISAAPAILEYAGEVDADLVVMSTHGRRGLGHVLLGSVTEEVVRLARCPVLTVRGGDGEGTAPLLEDVLVPVDYSEHAKHAVRCGKEIAAAYDARLHVVHVFERPIQPEIYLAGSGVEFPAFESVEPDLQKSLKTLVEQAKGPDVPTYVSVLEGRAVGGILDTAKQIQAGLIVIATHGLTGLAHVLLGSVAEKIVRRADCPVLTLKAFGKSLLE